MEAIFDRMIEKSLSDRKDSDFELNGILHCGICKQPRQAMMQLFQGETSRRVGIPCDCKKAEITARKAQLEHEEFERRLSWLRNDGIDDPTYRAHRFENDDQPEKEWSIACRRYAEQWDAMRAENIGMLLFGNVGTGKSFLACCIANALIDRMIPACVTSFPRILNMLQANKQREEIIDRLNRFELLVIDDLGTERDTDYAIEQVGHIIDSRYRSGKPVIVTTNLSLEDIQNPPNLAYSRIYERVIEMCPITLKMVGESRRIGIAAEKQKRALKILLGGGEQ